MSDITITENMKVIMDLAEIKSTVIECEKILAGDMNTILEIECKERTMGDVAVEYYGNETEKAGMIFETYWTDHPAPEGTKNMIIAHVVRNGLYKPKDISDDNKSKDTGNEQG